MFPKPPLDKLGTPVAAKRCRHNRTPQSETSMDHDKLKGMADQAKGAAKEGVGKVTGDTKMKVEGKLDKTKGKAERAVGEAKDKLRDLRDRE